MKPTSKSKPELYCFMNGKIMPLAKAALPITDVSIMRGHAVFDSMLAIGDRVLHVAEHLKRFFASAKISHIPLHYTKAEILEALQLVLRKNKLERSKVRIIATGGSVINSGLEYDTANGSLMIIVELYEEPASAVYEKGISLITAEYERPFADAKSTNYMFAVDMQDERKKSKAFEILYTSGKQAFECTTSNFFIVKGKELITADKAVLKGIIRAMVLRNAKKVGLQAVERPLMMKDIAAADEAFITGTYKGIIPVVKVDEMIIGNGKVGHAAQSFQELYRAFSA